MSWRVLILGGTGEARDLAGFLVGDGVDVVSSLAGRVARPRLPVGQVRVGGFGGVDGLAGFLREHGVGAVVDATHPFAARISANAAGACAVTGVPRLVVRRPGFTEPAGAGWTWVGSVADAADHVGRFSRRAFLTTGRQGLAEYASCGDTWFLVRCVDPPEPPLPPQHEVVLARGPFDVSSERDLMRAHRVDTLVTKDSGGSLTSGKLTAAADLGVRVVVVRRPPPPPGDVVGDAAAAHTWVRAIRR